MNELSFQYPSWYIFLCVLLGLLYAVGLYYNDRTFREQSNRLNWLLGSLRFLLATFLSILLLSPFLKSFTSQTQKPIVIIAQDASESVAAGITEDQRSSFENDMTQLAEDLSREYEVQRLAFGERVRDEFDFNFEDKISNTSDVFNYVNDLYSNENVGAVLIATDGIYNEGSNPLYVNSNISAPVFTIALGDTTIKKDVYLKRTFLNRIAYLNDRFVVQVDVAASNASGTQTTLSVFKVAGSGTQKLEDRIIPITSNDFFKTEEFILDANQAGVQRYRLRLSSVADEATTANNVKDIFIDVLDARQKILLLANSPHPDLAALKQSITQNKNYEVETAFADQFKGGLKEYDFVILHQLPSASYNIAPVLNTLKQDKIPHFFILGSQTDLNQFNTAQGLLSIRGDGRNYDDVVGRTNPLFSLFTIEEEMGRDLLNFAPMSAPFGEYAVTQSAEVLMYQRIGRIDMNSRPLLLFGEENNTKIGILTAEGIWKWRLFDYLQNQNHDIVDELIGKSIQYVSVKEDKRRFRVTPEKNIFNENEDILFDAELYNNSYELINDPDVNMTIIDSDSKEYDFVFDKTDRAYTLDANKLPEGNYTFRASVNVGGEQLNYNGQFSIQPIQLELFQTTADHRLLRLISDKYGGQFVRPDQISSLPQVLENLGTVKPVIYQTAQTRSVINLRWIFFLLLFLLATEWGLRRYFGGY
jgi:hypothetical protein